MAVVGVMEQQRLFRTFETPGIAGEQWDQARSINQARANSA